MNDFEDNQKVILGDAKPLLFGCDEFVVGQHFFLRVVDYLEGSSEVWFRKLRLQLLNSLGQTVNFLFSSSLIRSIRSSVSRALR